MAIFTGVMWIIDPEIYTPLILRRRAKKMSKMTGKVYKSTLEVQQGAKSIATELKTAISRPWALLFK